MEILIKILMERYRKILDNHIKASNKAFTLEAIIEYFIEDLGKIKDLCIKEKK